ncbi:MAG: hypothetical protein R3332_10075 [Pseudohongiellaceae bacterium]|nr:hypothetical protein [Pseudohongiellaceae bacterium]
MIQQVNLYLPEYRPRNDWLTASRFGAIVAMVVVLLAVLSGIDYGRRYLLEQEQGRVTRAVAAQTRVTEQIEEALAGMATDPALVRELSEREASLEQLEGTLSTLANLAQGNISGFSEHLMNMSRASFEGIWLTSISITDSGNTASLEGRAEEGAMVPKFVDRLSSGWSESEGWRFSRISSTAPSFSREASDSDEAQQSNAGASNSAPRAELSSDSPELVRAEQALERAGRLVDDGRALTQEAQAYRFVLEARNGR